MKKLINWLENSFAPKMSKVNNNIWVVTLKDSILQVLPFIFMGSIFCVLCVVEDYVTLPFSFWTPFGWTMSKISLFVSFLIPFNYCEKKRYRKQRIIGGLSGLILFLIAITPQVVADETVGFGHSALGAGGMFVAIVTGVITSLIFGAFAKFSFFKEDSAIPDFVRQWFDALLPIFLTVTLGWLVVQVLGFDLYQTVVNIFLPLQSFLNTWYGFTFWMFFTCFIYSMGISSWVLTPVGEPVRLQSIVANLAMVEAGTLTATTVNIYTEGLVYCTYMWVGGIGCTLPLVIMLMLSKSEELKALGRACLVPGIFNINEPVIFGCVAWNPYLMLPMWIIGIVMPLITYFFVKVIAFAPYPTIQFELWYCPYPIGTIISLINQGAGAVVKGLIFLVITIVVASVIWYPFFKAYEESKLEEEKALEAK